MSADSVNSMELFTNTPMHGATESLAVLTREVRIRLVNCSLSGCLLEANASLPVGTVAALTLRIGEHEFRDDVRVVRCQAIAGAGSRHLIGAQLVWTAVPGQQSLRLALQRRLSAPQQDVNAMF
jgi:hypothetical protein